jgi:type VII secretion integral membrane protein EccD
MTIRQDTRIEANPMSATVPALTPVRADAAPREPSANEFCRISVAGPRSRVDLAVPAAVPLARLLGALLRQAGEQVGPDGGVGHGGWVLRRPDGTRLDAARSLREQEVGEGDLLFLTHGRESDPPPLYDDVVELIGATGVRTAWSGRESRRMAAVLAGIAVLGAVLAVAGASGSVPGILALVAAVLMGGAGGLLSRAFGDIPAGVSAEVLAAPVAAVGAIKLLGFGPGLAGLSAGHLLLAVVVIAAVGAIGPVVVGGGDGVFAALITGSLLVAAGALVSLVSGIDAARAAALIVPLALTLTTLLPQLALNLARVPSPQVAGTADELERASGRLDFEEVTAKVAAARQLLSGMLAGTYFVATISVLILVGSRGVWSFVLGMVLLLLILLRSRLFRDAGQARMPWIAGSVILFGTAWTLAFRYAGNTGVLLGAVAPAAIVIVAVAGVAALASGRHKTSPRFSRMLDVCETVLLLGTIPLILAVWQVYPALLDIKA